MNNVANLLLGVLIGGVIGASLMKMQGDLIFTNYINELNTTLVKKGVAEYCNTGKISWKDECPN